MATNPDVEGEATALYLARLLKPRGIASDPPGLRHAGGRRHRIHRRSHPGARPGSGRVEM